MNPLAVLPLITERLIIRDFEETDFLDVHAFRSDPEVARYMGFVAEQPEQSRAWLDGVIFHNRKRPRVAYNLAIVHRGDDRVIGWIGIGDSERYPAAGELGFGYMLNRTYWGRGCTTEAVGTILDFGFTALAGQRVSAWCYAANRTSARVLEKAGLRFEGHFTGTEPVSETGADCIEFALTVEEWRVARLPI